MQDDYGNSAIAAQKPEEDQKQLEKELKRANNIKNTVNEVATTFEILQTSMNDLVVYLKGQTIDTKSNLSDKPPITSAITTTEAQKQLDRFTKPYTSF